VNEAPSRAHRGVLDEGRKPTDPVRILALDGGGMRGVMTARILVELERLSGKPIPGLFDVVAGTSTGGMIALALTKPGTGGLPALSAKDVLDIYVNKGRKIFPRAVWRPFGWQQVRASRPIVAQRVGAFAMPGRYSNARYSRAGLSSLLFDVFGATLLSQAMADVIVPAYDWKAGRAYVFRSRGARNGDLVDPAMAQVAMATTAAPTYFPAFRMRVPDRELVLIDGGLVANNPASVAYYEALYHASMAGQTDPDFLVVSLGTGQPPEKEPTYQELWSRSWLRMGMGMLGVMFDGSSEIVDDLLTEVVRPRHPKSRYWRLNAELTGVRLNMDDASAGQMQKLIGLAEDTISKHEEDLAEMVRLLSPPPPEPERSSDTPDAEPGSARRSGGGRRRRSTA
jgi:predicted acylesterase/phospholipase RssA